MNVQVVRRRCAQRKGVSAYFPGSISEELLALRGNVGAHDLLTGAKVIDSIWLEGNSR
jgi:hypothetical protein